PGRMYTSPFTSQLTGEKSDTDQSCCPDLPGPDSRPAELLGGTRLRNPAALRHGGGCRDVPYRHLPAFDRPGNLERGLCPAQPPSGRRPLWREPQPPAALLPVPGGAQAEPGQYPGAVPGL